MVLKTLSQCGSKLTLKVNNQLTIDEYKDFVASFELLNAMRTSVEIDFKLTNKLDTAALGMLLLLSDKLTKLKGDLSIALPAEHTPAYHLLTLTKFDQKFAVVKPH